MANINQYDDWEYKLIDGNWTRNPCAYCNYRHAYLTKGLMNTHQCIERQCKSIRMDWQRVDET